MWSVRQRVEHSGIHLVEALSNFFPKVIQLSLDSIEALSDFFEALSDFFEALSDFFEALSDFFFEVLQLTLYIFEALGNRLITLTSIVLFPLKFVSDKCALLLELSPKVVILGFL